MIGKQIKHPSKKKPNNNHIRLSHLRRGNDRQFFADGFGVDSQFGLRSGRCVTFLIESTRRSYRLLLLLSGHGNLVKAANTNLIKTKNPVCIAEEELHKTKDEN
jgi:hypothetical protein